MEISAATVRSVITNILRAEIAPHINDQIWLESLEVRTMGTSQVYLDHTSVVRLKKLFQARLDSLAQEDKVPLLHLMRELNGTEQFRLSNL